MAKKKSPAELKQEGVVLAEKISAARKKPYNFALLMGKDGLFLETHLKKSPDFLWRQAKKAGGGPKGVMGTMTVKGKIINMACLSDDAPAALPKLAKKFFAERGQPYKVVLSMPGGTLGDEDEGEDDAGDQEARRASLISDFKAFSTELKDAMVQVDADTKKALGGEAQTFGKLVKGDDLDAAEASLEKLKADVTAGLAAKPATPKPQTEEGSAPPQPPQGEKPGATPTPDAPVDDPRHKELMAQFKAIEPQVIKAAASSNAGAAKKTQTLADMFAQDMADKNYDKAAKTLQLLKKTAVSASKLPADDSQVEQVTKFFSGIGAKLGAEAAGLAASANKTLTDIGNTASNAGDALGEAWDDLADSARDAVGVLSEEDEANKDKVDDFGLTEDQQMVLVRAARDDPAAITAALPVLEKVKTLKLPPAQFENLLAMSKSEPKAFEATIAAMANIDGAGAMDVSTEAVTKSLQNVEAKRQISREKYNEYLEKIEANELAAKKHQEAEVALKAAVQAEKDAAAALKAFQDSLPKDLSTLSDADRRTALAEANRLTNVHGAATTALTAATNAEATAATDWRNAYRAYEQAKTAKDTANKDARDAQAAHETIADKRDLIDAISFGPLSDDAKVPLDDEAKAKMIEAYGKAPDVGQEALNLIKNMDDPSVVVENVGAIVDRLEGGFADAKGKKLEIEKPDGSKGPPSKEAGEAMAIGALKLGASRGQDYFDGFNAYMDSGAQLKKDPCGGTDKEPHELEGKDIDAAAQKRSALMADGAIQRDGTVDFDSKNAKKAMDHVLYHPGSLMTYSPHGIDQIEKTKGLFEDPTTKDKANEIIGDTKVPGRGVNQHGRARRLIADTTGKSSRQISHNDAKESVLSAMMTPLSQGPVGSCFSTAPVRRLKETEPLKAMEAFSGIVNTGTVKMDDGTIYPANMSAHEGQNPLMRSWEYTIADAGANIDQSERKEWDSHVAMGTTDPPKKNFSGIKDLLDDPADWSGTGVMDPVTLEVDNGVEGRIKKAIRTEFKYVYNAAPGSKRDATGGSGDGRSTDGGYEIYYDGKIINSKESYVNAMKDIALNALPSDATQDEKDKVTALVTSEDFVKATTKLNDDPPWERGAGYSADTSTVLRGGTPVDNTFKDEKATPSTSTDEALDRSKVILEELMGAINGMTGDMEIIGTSGTGAHHAFNAVPNHPSLDKIKGPNTAAKIQSELLDPGQKISEKKLPAAKAGKIFDKALQRISRSVETENHDLISTALEKRPTQDMSPKELDAHIDQVTDDFKKAVAKDKTDAWKKAEEAEGRVVNQAKYDAEEAKQKGLQDMRVDSATAGALAAEVELPEVVVADTNWGDATRQLYYVFAPDPATGKIRMWEKNEFDGTLSPVGANWTDAGWSKVDG